MAVVLLDTTVLIDVLRGRPAVGRLSDLHRRGDAPVVCAINVEEVVRGLRPPEVAAAERFLRGLPVVPLARGEGARAGAWRRDHAARGITLSQSDCLVAAAAARAGGRLATGNPRHFPMPELTVEHWPVGG
ncbi:MAG: PIN domain-containing protein [Euzebyaceae bacterium]|nr:PIN domain-containing protein [Euzebyaceae bacterium]